MCELCEKMAVGDMTGADVIATLRSAMADAALGKLRDMIHYGDWDLAHTKIHELVQMGMLADLNKDQLVKFGYVCLAVCGEHSSDIFGDRVAVGLSLIGERLGIEPEAVQDVPHFVAYVKAMRKLSIAYRDESRQLFADAGFVASDNDRAWSLGPDMDPDNPPHIQIDGEHAEKYCWCTDRYVVSDDDVMAEMRVIYATSQS
ncbi:MAG TPA: hypothetical protein VIY48_11180 [Candidatus Paceibacterota bacterium]